MICTRVWHEKTTIREIPVNPNNCSDSQWMLLWYRQNPNADSVIVRFCRSSWPFSKTHSLCRVWYLSLCSWVALIFWGPLSLLCVAFLSWPLLLDWKFHLNSMSKGIWTLPGKYHMNGLILEASPIPSHHLLLFSTTFLFIFAELWD